jgi:betaine-aldehyde dehydrogenase
MNAFSSYPPLAQPRNLLSLIDGELCEGDGDGVLEVIAPTTGEPLCDALKESSAAQIQRALASARECFDNSDWSLPSNTEQRCDLLRNLAKKLEDDKDFLAHLESSDSGKTVGDAEFDISDSIGSLRYYSILASRALGTNGYRRTVDTRHGENMSCEVDRVPIGVVGAPTPWNYPVRRLFVVIARPSLIDRSLV